MHEIDSPDFNKARSFLMGFSIFTILLWFFEIDITKLKILGNSLEPHKNSEHAWLVIAAIASYLWIRFLQRLPERSLKPNQEMHKIFDDCLVSICRKLYKRSAIRFAQEEISEDEGVPIRIISLRMTGLLDYHEEMTRMQPEPYGAKHPWDYGYPQRAEISFLLTKRYYRQENVVTSSGGKVYEVTPNRFLYVSIYNYALLKGMIGKAWFSDNVWPLLLGALSISAAIYQWLTQ